MIIKAMKNGLGEWGVFYGTEKATRLAYARFFKTQEAAEKWAEKFRASMSNSNYKSQRKLNA